jgi:hypothetical protein
VIGEWMKKRRRWVDQDIGGDEFVSCWWDWWGNLKDSPEGLNVAGPNRLVLVILALAWWGESDAGHDLGEGPGWREAVEEVTTVIWGLSPKQTKYVLFLISDISS